MGILITILSIFITINLFSQQSPRQLFWALNKPRGGYDVDAKKFIDSTQITDSSLKSQLNILVRRLKDSSLWSKVIAIYPVASDGIMQTRAYQQKWNLKDPRNLDAAYRLTFNGTSTFDGDGFTSDGVSGYANTHLNANSILTNSNSY